MKIILNTITHSFYIGLMAIAYAFIVVCKWLFSPRHPVLCFIFLLLFMWDINRPELVRAIILALAVMSCCKYVVYEIGSKAHRDKNKERRNELEG
jgi:hypothetical protein